PLLDRASRMMLRNLKALDELHKGPTPSVSVKQADQVNVRQQQVNIAGQRSKRRKATVAADAAVRRRREDFRCCLEPRIPNLTTINSNRGPADVHLLPPNDTYPRRRSIRWSPQVPRCRGISGTQRGFPEMLDGRP